MKFDLAEFRADDAKQKDGVWVDFGGGASFRIASFDAEDFSRAFRRATKPYTDLGRDIPEQDQEDIMIKLLASHIVRDWSGVYDGDDELPYSQDAALRVLREIPWVRARVLTESRKIANFRDDARQATVGNSPRASAGT